VRLHGVPTNSSASTCFHVLHGPWLSGWAGRPDVQPLWSSDLAATHGTYGVPWWHGTASDNGFSALCFGLRSMSGTRHASSGAMYGDGVYCCEDARVSLKFAPRSGLTWVGASDALGRAEGAMPLPPKLLAVGGGGGGREGPHVVPATYRLVLAVDVIAAPGTRLVHNGSDVTASSTRPGGKGYDVPPASYVIVPQASSMWVRAVHVHEEGPKREAAGPAAAAAAVTAGGGAGACGSSSWVPWAAAGVAVTVAAALRALARF
jgi:hypothetical protein